MNREQAKIWAKIPRKELKIIAPNIDKHFDVLRAYANGKEIEVKDLRDWHDIEDPNFNENFEYRVKQDNDKSPKPYKLRNGDTYFFFSSDGSIFISEWLNEQLDIRRLNFGNCFPTEVACKAAIKSIKELIKLRKSDTITINKK